MPNSSTKLYIVFFIWKGTTRQHFDLILSAAEKTGKIPDRARSRCDYTISSESRSPVPVQFAGGLVSLFAVNRNAKSWAPPTFLLEFLIKPLARCKKPIGTSMNHLSRKQAAWTHVSVMLSDSNDGLCTLFLAPFTLSLGQLCHKILFYCFLSAVSGPFSFATFQVAWK